MTMHVETPQSRCRFGVDYCDITPPVGIYHRMWGAATHDRSTGIHRSLTATAAVFQPLAASESSDNEQVLVAVDHCLLWSGEMESLLSAICATNGLRREQVIVSFSHTHGAGLMDSGRSDLPGGELIAPYLREMGEKIAAAVATARDTVQPVTIVYGSGVCDLATHRDLWDAASNQWVCGFNPAGAADQTILVARVTDASDATVASFVNYACHPTTLAWDNTLISPDYVGAMRDVVEDATGAPCVFLQGASGDIGPREGFVGDTAVADRNGRRLGHAALAALESLPPPLTRYAYTGPVISGATIGTWAHQPLPEDSIDRLAAFEVQRWTVELPYLPGQPTVEQLESESQQWEQAEREALAAGDTIKARDCRALVERKTRALTRARGLPCGETFPYPVVLWKLGDVLWLAVEGEPYQLLQTRIRQRYRNTPIIVSVLANGSRCFYLPTREMYGTGVYQETAAVLAAGSLETLIEAIESRLDAIVGPQ